MELFEEIIRSFEILKTHYTPAAFYHRFMNTSLPTRTWVQYRLGSWHLDPKTYDYTSDSRLYGLFIRHGVFHER